MTDAASHSVRAGTERGAHDFLVSAVEPTVVEGSIAVTLTDARGGRVTLHLDELCATLLRDLIDDQLA